MTKFITKSRGYVGGSLVRDEGVPQLPETNKPSANTQVGFVSGAQGSVANQGQMGTGGNFVHASGGSIKVNTVNGVGIQHSMKLLKNVNFRKPKKETSEEKNIKFIY